MKRVASALFVVLLGLLVVAMPASAAPAAATTSAPPAGASAGVPADSTSSGGEVDPLGEVRAAELPPTIKVGTEGVTRRSATTVARGTT